LCIGQPVETTGCRGSQSLSKVLVPKFNQNFGVKCRAANRTAKAIGSDDALVATMVEK
jgi:hypothetical protein